MIRVERNPLFWLGVVSHPEVRKTLLGLTPDEFSAFALCDNVLPLASEHGGFFFVDVGGTGFISEFHTMFTPEGWGREVALAAKEAIHWLFNKGTKLLITYEQFNNPRSKPPKSFGFVSHGDFTESSVGQLKLWSLSIDSWYASPVYKRLK